MTDNVSYLTDIRVEGEGSFTPPPSPCGNPECGYEGLDLVHVEECEEA